MSLWLKDRVAVVTGAGNGIGRAEALEMARQGAKVVVNDIGTDIAGAGSSRNPAEAVVRQITENGGTAVSSFGNVMYEGGAQSIVQTALDVFGRIDILVNNAGIVRDPVNVADLSFDDWESILKTHLGGTFYCTRFACAQMRKQGYGRIINTASHVGLGSKGFTAYGAAKEGIVGFTRNVAHDMAEYGVCCNVIRPIAAWRGTRQKSERLEPNLPEDVAVLTAYLAGEEAGHINGRCFEVWRGHVGLFQEPPPVQKVITRDGHWTVDDLVDRIPRDLTRGMQIDDLPRALNLG